MSRRAARNALNILVRNHKGKRSLVRLRGE
jgi:hypothetical protein